MGLLIFIIFIIINIHIVVPAELQTSPSGSVESFAPPLVLSVSFSLIHGGSVWISDGEYGWPTSVPLRPPCVFRSVQRGHWLMAFWRYLAGLAAPPPTTSQAEGRSLQLNLRFLPAGRVQRPPDRLRLGNVHKSHLVDSSAFSLRFSPHLAR